jgi:hypothetical protein
MHSVDNLGEVLQMINYQKPTKEDVISQCRGLSCGTIAGLINARMYSVVENWHWGFINFVEENYQPTWDRWQDAYESYLAWQKEVETRRLAITSSNPLFDLWVQKNGRKEYQMNADFSKKGFSTFKEVEEFTARRTFPSFLWWIEDDSVLTKIKTDEELHLLYDKYYEEWFDYWGDKHYEQDYCIVLDN